MDIKDFLYRNKLKQVDLANYLGISGAAVSRLCKEYSNPSEDNLAKLLSNPYGWDTSMLMGNVTANANNHSSASVSIGSAEVDNMRKEIERLKALLEEEKTRSAQYWEMIQKLLAR